MDVRTTLGLCDYLEVCRYSNVYETGCISQECVFLHLVLHSVIPWDTEIIIITMYDYLK